MSTVKIAGLNLQLQAVVDGDDMVVPLQPINVPVQPGQVAGVLAALGLSMKKISTDLAKSYDEQVAEQPEQLQTTGEPRTRLELSQNILDLEKRLAELDMEIAHSEGITKGLGGAPNRATRRAALKSVK